MVETVNWIHFSDLHFGLDRDGWLWPTVKHRVIRDLESLSDRVPSWDLVFFTGDLVQSGASEEYGRLNSELEDIWKVIGKRGAPKLCVVPGNHDLVRPTSSSAVAKALTTVWPSDKEMQRLFWTNPSSEYRHAVDEFFENYMRFLTTVSVPLLEVTRGVLPGDFSATYTKGEVKLGIVGLNSTFLQIMRGDFKGKLSVHVSQLNAVCDRDPEKWIRGRTASLLLMHHPPSWLSGDSFSHYRQEIYPSGRFLALLCGHQHEPEHFELAEAGAAPRRLRQAPSLFGLTTWEGLEPEKRTHGYNAGQFVFQTTEGFEKMWPKIAVPGRDGALNIAPDYTYSLKDECVVTSFDLQTETATPEVVKATPVEPTLTSSASAAPQELSLLDAEPTEALARMHLSACPRFTAVPAPQYRATRQDEQSQFEHALRKSRRVWLAADWGAGQEGFLAAALERLSDLLGSSGLRDAFILRCDDATDVAAFEALFPQQFGYSLQRFSTYAAALPSAVLILDAVHPDLCAGTSYDGLSRIANAIVEYCPNLQLVITSRLPPADNSFSTVRLRPLDLPEVRTYLMQHPDATPETRDPDLLETLHERSDGLPMHIDRLVKAMKVASPEAVLEADRERSLTAHDLREPVSKALSHAVETILSSQDRPSRRSLKLLKVLTLLPYGETLDSLRHYLPAEPFFPENALQLQELALIDVIPLQQTTPRLGSGDMRSTEPAPKLLKVPRQVRDYVIRMISDDERDEIVQAGIERFFGRGWRAGKLRVRKMPPEYREYLSAGPGNEFALIHQLMTIARSRGELPVVAKAAALGIQYGHHLESAERFHDLAVAGGALLQLVDRERQGKEWAQLAALYGAGLRMSGKKDESLSYLRAAIEAGATQFSDNQKADIYLDIALAEHKEGNLDGTLAAADEIKKYVREDSGTALQAASLVADLSLKGQERKKTLAEIERKARSNDRINLGNGIAMLLYGEEENNAEALKHLQRVLDSKRFGYTYIRALVSKANTLNALDQQAQVTPLELVELSRAYTYLHSQRFGDLFDRCHDALWSLLEVLGDMQRLLRLFRHSSFLWRLRGLDEKETEYLKRLADKKIQDQSPARTVVVEFSYFMRRLRIVFHINE